MKKGTILLQIAKKSFNGRGQSVAARLHVAWAKQSKSQPILIYQMGKVGSSTVYHSLKAERLANPLFHVHFLSRDLPYYKKLHIRAGIIPVPYHLELGLALRNQWIIKSAGKKFKVITMVRDPVARQISDIFQNPEFMGADMRGAKRNIDPDIAIPLIKDKLYRIASYQYVFHWFDREIKAVFGLDVFGEPFDMDSGWKIYRNDHADVLVLRVEDLDRAGPIAISNFLDLPEKLNLINSNVRANTEESITYRFIKNMTNLPASVCEQIYSSTFVRHFYNDRQIEKMISRWCN
ncbi:MAG: putative capsular polysaccharide synthesis family protein [Deltaproteobacteria bacterium]|jgi:hypothetical protein